MEADFVRYYNLSLPEEVQNGSLRRLLLLVEGLPDEAAIWRQNGTRWTMRDELQALNIEVLDMMRRESFSVQTGKEHPGTPIRIPRPYDEDQLPPQKKEVETDPEKIGAFFGKWLS